MASPKVHAWTVEGKASVALLVRVLARKRLIVKNVVVHPCVELIVPMLEG